MVVATAASSRRDAVGKEARFREAAPAGMAVIHILSGADYGADGGASVTIGVVGPWRNAYE